MFRRILLSVILAILAATPCQADLKDLMKSKGRKILFLGDSNTYAGLYIAYVEGYLRTRFPEEPWELINLGLPSETVTGLSEQDHPYPRPDVHTRVDRALEKIKPNIVFVCYGMNDGIYSPFSEDRLTKYKERTEKLVAKIEKAGAKATLMTPSPFDATPITKNLLPKDAPKFSWMKPYEKYDAEVLRKYSDYLLEWRKKDYIVIDAHAAVHRFLKAMREKDPKYTVSGDGIHPNPTGHAVIAFEILRELKAPAEVDRIEVGFAAGKAKQGDGSAFEVMKDSLKVRFRGKSLMPADTRWDKRLQEIEHYQEQFNQFPLIVSGLPQGKYEIVADQVVGTATSDELAKGISIARFKGLRIFGDTAEIGKRIRDRQQRMGLAWLTEIGHKRPDTPKSTEPFDKALAEDLKARTEMTELLRQRGRGEFQELLIRKVD
jgi:lysophospholipase L1-like esterase